MYNKGSLDLDSLKINQNNKITRHFDPEQYVILSAIVIKINHVDKKQERSLAITNKSVINLASPNSLLPNRIKRKIPLHKITGITASRYVNQVVFHVEGQEDYRFFTPNLKNLYIQTLILVIGKATNQPANVYWYDDLTLDQYTTTIIDLKNQTRKQHLTKPTIVDQEFLKKKVQSQSESKAIFKGKDSQNIQKFEQFDIIKVLGRGAYGKVMLCKHKKSQKYYAVKSMRKEDFIQKDCIERAKTQRLLLEKANHPFLVNLEYAFQTKQKIFLIMKFMRGGDMFSKIKKEKKFSEQRTKFYATQVFLALQHLHSLGFVYRDLKPQNILFEVNGYIKVTDYGLAKELKNGEKTNSLTGTASYLSPQVIMNEGHTFTVDWWAFGVLIYEMLFSRPPFYCKDQREMFSRIVNKELEFPVNSNISDQCQHLLRNLLNKYPHKRLGHQGSQQIKKHPWFKDINWNQLFQMKITAEYIPKTVSDEDVSNFLEVFTNQEPIDTILNSDQDLLKKFQKEFQGFDYKRLQEYDKLTKNTTITPQFQSKMPYKINQQSIISVPRFIRNKT